MPDFETDARFAIGPGASHLSSCGPETAPGTLLRYLQTGEDSGIHEMLKKYPNLDSFQATLAEIAGLDPFDPQVQEAYWLGNRLLQKATDPENYEKLLNHYQRHGAFSGFIAELKKRKPQETIFHHNFQVAWIGIENIGGKLDRSLGAVNQCMIRGGKVMNISGNTAHVNQFTLEKSAGNQYYLGIKEQEIKFDTALVDNLQPGDLVATHWGAVATQISQNQLTALEYWTERVVELL